MAFLLFACSLGTDEQLRRAATKGYTDEVSLLLNKGANVNYKKGGWTILMFVSREGNTEVARMLL